MVGHAAQQHQLEVERGEGASGVLSGGHAIHRRADRAAAVGEKEDRIDVPRAAERQHPAQQALGDDVRGLRLVGLQREAAQGHPVAAGQDPAVVAEQRQVRHHRGDRLDAGLQLDEQGRPVARQDGGRPAQDRELAAVHVDLDEPDILEAEFVEGDTADRQCRGVDVPADQGGHAPVARVVRRQPEPGRAGALGRRGLHDPHVGRGRRREQPCEVRDRFHGHHPAGPPRQPPRPRAVPAADVHGRPAPGGAQLRQPGQLRLEARVHGPGRGGDQAGGQQRGDARSQGHGAIRWRSSSCSSSETCSPRPAAAGGCRPRSGNGGAGAGCTGPRPPPPHRPARPVRRGAAGPCPAGTPGSAAAGRRASWRDANSLAPMGG